RPPPCPTLLPYTTLFRSTSARRYASTSELSLSVRRNIGAIGFVGLSGIAPARAIAVTSGDSQPMLPTAELITTEDYPLARRLFIDRKSTRLNSSHVKISY